ncbi:MAG TPA: Ig-like domain-containing protein [Microbacterium sp.]|uniref:Ig-like domain-containing protein n=1 Tax=Microbacterium sp. TaxID=51671 RepID=UPI002B6A08FF|nr:Ig-like domain-containing protein [Microbacterium sp.]HWI31648.1 Ig-like domain-containing protein [Microbacterium sp.]
MMDEVEHDARSPKELSRRGFMTIAAGGVGGLLLASAGAPAWAATPSPTPKLPGEYFRRANQVTTGGTLFDNVCVRIDGDAARIYVPQSVKPYSGVPVPVVWFFHGSGSDHNALDGGFKSSSQAVVDRGAIAICQTAGGTLYSHPTAVALQVAGYSYMSGLFTISTNTLRSTSGGGALCIETYATGLLPNIAGMYNVNSSYNLRAHYDQGGSGQASIIAAFGDDLAAIEAANPARHPAASWTAAKMRIVVSQPNESDTVVPPQDHGLALLALAAPVAAEASLRTHANGHSTPGFATADFLAAAERWSAFGSTPPPDTQQPVVSFVQPVSGATLSGTTTVIINATDNVGVVDVGIYVGTRRMGTAAFTGSDYRLTFNTNTSATPNGTYVATARATDAAGNVGVSAPITVTVAN